LIIIIAIVAVVVALAVVAVIVLKKKGAQSSPDRGVAFGGVGFENPLCKFWPLVFIALANVEGLH
jgi:preprotein translocase subunit SecG